MDGNQEVSAHLARLVDPRVEGQEVVAVTREESAHVRLGVDQRLQPLGDHQRHVLLARAAPPDGARILAAVAGVDHDRGEAHHGRCRWGIGLGALLDQLGERIQRNDGVDVEHQAIAVLGDGREREGLRLHLGLEVEHHAHDARPVARHAQAFDVGVVGRHLAVELGERGGHVRLEVEHQALRILDREHLVLQLRFRFNGEPRVIARRPDPAGDYLRFNRAG